MISTRKLRRGAIAIVLTLLLAVLAAFAWVQTPPGKRQLARAIEHAVSDDTLSLTLGEIEGFLPFELRLSGLTVADDDGIWLRLDKVALDWSPLALLAGRVDVDAVRLDRIALDRLPDGSPQAESGGSFSMPLALRVAAFEVAEVVLAEPVLGAPARLSIAGAAELADPIAGFRLTADARRIDAVQGTLSIDLGYDPDTGDLTAEVAGAEPAGGVIARMLDLPGLPPVTLDLSGEGPVEDWRADLSLNAGPDFGADAALSLRAEEGGHRLAIDAGATLAGVLRGPAEPLLAGRGTLRGSAMIRRDGIVELNGVTLKTSAGDVVLDGSVDGSRKTLDVRAAVTAAGPDVFASLIPGIGWDGARADIRIQGPLAGPRVEVSATVDEVATEGLALDQIAARFTFDPVRIAGPDDGGGIPLEGHGRLSGLSTGDTALDALLGPAITWAVAGTAGWDGSTSLDRLTIEGAGVAMAASGAAGADGEIDGQGTVSVADLGLFRPLAGLPLSGEAELSWRAGSADGGLAFEADGRLSHARSGLAAVDALLADMVEFRSAATIGADGAVDVTEFGIDGGGVAITGQLAYADDRLSSDWSLTLASIAGLSDLAGAGIDGRVTAGGRLQGRLDRLSLQSELSGEALVVDGTAVPDLTARLSLDDLTGRLTGDVRLEAFVADHPAVLEVGLELPDSGSVRFDPVGGDFAGWTISGAVDLLSDGGVVGRLAARSEQVAPLAALLDVPLSGRADVVASITASDGRQRLQASLEMSDAAFNGDVDAATASAGLVVDDLLGTRQLDGQATILGLASGAAVFDRVALGVRGNPDALDISLAVTGEPLAGDATAAVSFPDAGTRIDLRTLSAVIRGEAFALAAPATISLSPRAVSVERLVITGGGGQAAVVGTLGDTLDASVDFVDVPLALVSLIEPGLAFSGHIDGEARISGPAERPEGTFAFRSDDLRSGFAEEVDLPPADLTLEGRWSEGRLALDVAAGLADGAGMTIKAELPLAIVPESGAPVLDPNADIVASAEGTLDLSLFDDLLAAGGNRVEGLLTVDLRVGGSVGEPVVSGTAVMSDGRYENAFYGSRLDGISAVVAASGTGLRLTDLSATTPGGGTLAGTGSLALDPAKGYPLVLDVGLRNGAVVDTALASATADADLRLSGALTDKLLLSGEVSLLGAEFRVPDRLPVSVPDLPVEEVNLPPEIAAGRAAQRSAGPEAAVDADLDLVASARQAVFVRGRGLNVELDGDLTIKGSAAAPEIDGELGLRNGTFDIFGRRLTFQRGGLDFDGSSDLDPEIDLLATADIDAVSVEVGVSGRVSEPTITLTSVPEMPRDEIAARLLFGKDVRSLSAFEAVTLAQSLGQLTGLTGSSGGILDEMRQRIGLDRLEVDVGGSGDASVSGGRYVSDGVYVGVEQGLDEQSSRVNVEIEVTPNITVESDVGADAEGRIGVNVEWDY